MKRPGQNIGWMQLTSGSESLGKNASPGLTNHDASILGTKHKRAIAKSVIAYTVLWRYLPKAMLPSLSYLLRLPLHALHLRAANIQPVLESFGNRGTTPEFGNDASPIRSNHVARFLFEIGTERPLQRGFRSFCSGQVPVELVVVVNSATFKS